MNHKGYDQFIFVTGLAALIHSTWTLGTTFNGYAPNHESITVMAFLEWLYWLAPAFLLAFALDVGQITTSQQIRAAHDEGLKPIRKYIAFAMMAFSTYLLQWIYIASHMPQIHLGEGVSDYWQGYAQNLVDLSLWLIPALFPITTLSYTFAGFEDKKRLQPPPTQPTAAPQPEQTKEIIIVAEEADFLAYSPNPNGHN